MAKRKYGVAFPKTTKPGVRQRKMRYKRRRKMLRRNLFSLPVTGFPKSKMVRLRYAEEIPLNATAAGVDYYTFSANGMYDPNITGTGHQPIGFDQNMLFFDHYCVVASRCRARFVPTTVSNSVPSYFDVLLTDDAATPASFTSVSHFLESNFSKGPSMKQMGTERNYVGWNPWVTKWFSAKKFFRKSKVVDDDQLQGSVASNPVEQAFFQICSASVGGVDSAAVTVLVVIDYWAILKEPKLISQS